MEFTDRQKRMLLALVRREARVMGYGVYPAPWSEFNRPLWPERLKELRRIAVKLGEAIDLLPPPPDE